MSGNSSSKTVTRYWFKPHLVDECEEWSKEQPHARIVPLMRGESFRPKGNELILVLGGYAHLFCRSKIGDEKLTFLVGRNALANGSAALTGGNHLLRLLAPIPCTLAVFDVPLLEESFIRDNPALIIELSRSIAKTTNLFNLRAFNMCFHSSVSRLCSVINRMTTQEQSPPDRQVSSITQSDIGALSGLHPVTVSNTIDVLRSAGIIGEISKSHIDVIDRNKLLEIEAYGYGYDKGRK